MGNKKIDKNKFELFREWLEGIINDEDPLLRSEVVNSGAFLLSCSPLTTRRYLDKLTSFVGPYRVYRESGAVWVTKRGTLS